MTQQTELGLKHSKSRAKRPDLEYRRLVAKAELKAVEAEEKKMATNRRRYYLHRKCRQHGLRVRAAKRTVIYSGEVTSRQKYYIGQLADIGYTIQSSI